MFAAYYSYLELANFEHAKRVIQLIGRYHPELQGSEIIAKAISDFKERQEEVETGGKASQKKMTDE